MKTTTPIIYASPELEQLRQLVAGARAQLAELETDVDPKRVWTDSQNDLPPLIARLEKYLATQT
jgi:uncharacterized protein with HEPN domain